MSGARLLKMAMGVSIAFSLFIYIVLRNKLGSSVLHDFPHIGKLIHIEIQLEQRNGTTVNQTSEPPTNITAVGTMEPHFIQTSLNKTFVTELRQKVEKILELWQVMQIFRANVEPKHMIQREKYKDINKPDALRVTDEFQHRLNSCALVGNSGILLNSSCGDVIDQADIIIRMNLANYSDEYSSDVGSRVSFMTINGEQVRQLISCFVKTVTDKRTGKNTTEIKSESLDKLPTVCGNLIGKLSLLSNDSVLWPSRGHLHKLVGLLPVLRGRFHLNFAIGYNPANLIRAAGRLWRFRKPSSGLTLLSASILLCEETSLFGFYPFYTDQYNRTIPHHYYEPEVQMNYTTNAHALPDEYKFLLNLENKGAIRMINNCTANSTIQHA